MITNNLGISLTLAVWLISDDYDYIDKENYISVTTLMKPLRQIILANRIPKEEREEDVVDFIARGLGNSIHDSIEKAWVHNYRRNLTKLGYPESVIDSIKINPNPAEVGPNDIPVYIEQRMFREYQGFTIGGKFDLVAEGHVEDNKSTSAYGWVYGTRDEEHQLQGSLYRWIDSVAEFPMITEDFMKVNYIFTDWQKAQARSNPKYPQKRVEEKVINLLSLQESELFVSQKLDLIRMLWKTPEKDLPECTDEELWRSDPKYKYFSDPEKAKQPGARSTKNFDSHAEASRYMNGEKGGKGAIITVIGEPKRCGYCAAFDICTQKDRYFNND